ncbi:winged helix-turn-helix domain-containing protein [Kribbella sp. NPDC000426]|uniref:winged helix-turn-helix domain-containing protein n=1 Tax=Kribbella sp. NPDC000426 TaxID=3154255 RepID=UPI0033271929
MVTARIDLTTTGSDDEPFPLLIAVSASAEQRVRLAELVDDVAPLLLVSSLDELRRLLVPAQQPPPAAPEHPEPPEPDAVEAGAVRASGDEPDADVLTIDRARSVARWRDREIQLTDLEHDLLTRLMSTPLRVWSYDALHQTVWRDLNDRGTADVHSVVKRLRRKLDELGTTVTIDAVRGIGFRLTDHQRPMITDLRAG